MEEETSQHQMRLKIKPRRYNNSTLLLLTLLFIPTFLFVFKALERSLTGRELFNVNEKIPPEQELDTKDEMVEYDTFKFKPQVNPGAPKTYFIEDSYPLGNRLKELGWTHVKKSSDATVIISFRVKDTIEKKQIRSNLGDVKCLGGSKTSQLNCRKSYANQCGCDFDSLQIQPPQYDMKYKSDCEVFHQVLQQNT